MARPFPSILRKAANLLRREYIPPEELAYRRLGRKGFRPASVIDVGAYEGNWTRLVRRVFPDVPVLMVEPQQAKRPLLERVCRELRGVTFEPALLGRRSGSAVSFHEMETGSSMFPERSNVPRRIRELTTITLDDLAQSMKPPLFLKIDVQGAELEVLAGAIETLVRCEVVQLEVAVLPYNEGAPAMLEVLSFMDERDFVPFDISGFSRPNGVDLAQIDLLFTRRSSPLRTLFFNF